MRRPKDQKKYHAVMIISIMRYDWEGVKAWGGIQPGSVFGSIPVPNRGMGRPISNGVNATVLHGS